VSATLIPLDEIVRARERISAHVHRTPTWRSTTLSERFGTNVYLKCELFQKTGSFKPRGTFNQLLTAIAEAGADRFVGVSGGNFAQALAYAGTTLGVETTVVMAASTPAHYVSATRGYGATVEFAPDVTAAFARVDSLAAEGATIAHPFDRPSMMAGNGTLGMEIVEDVPDLTDVFVSVGGGGLITGVGSAIKAMRPEARIWAVETEGADVLSRSLAAGGPQRMAPTSLARTLGSPYLAAAAYDFAAANVENALVTTDRMAYDALLFLLERAKVVPELAAACTLAALEGIREREGGRFGWNEHVVLLLCGGNVSPEDLVHYREEFGTH